MSPSIRSHRMAVDCSTTHSLSGSIVVSGGWRCSPTARLSKPTTETSEGTVRFASWSAASAPIASWSVIANLLLIGFVVPGQSTLIPLYRMLVGMKLVDDLNGLIIMYLGGSVFCYFQIPNPRWPGGCFADDYHWRDGIGPREQRPRMVNSHWGEVVEGNSFGTHEFMRLCELRGADPYISGNIGSGTVREMSEWIESLTRDDDSPMAARRRREHRRLRLN